MRENCPAALSWAGAANGDFQRYVPSGCDLKSQYLRLCCFRVYPSCNSTQAFIIDIVSFLETKIILWAIFEATVSNYLKNIHTWVFFPTSLTLLHSTIIILLESVIIYMPVYLLVTKRCADLLPQNKEAALGNSASCPTDLWTAPGVRLIHILTVNWHQFTSSVYNIPKEWGWHHLC